MRNLLAGVKVVELAGLAPVPHCGMMLADAGADVTVVDREVDETMVEQRLGRGKKTLRLNLKTAEGIKQVRDMCRVSDVLLDPFRPGVLEKIGLDPVDLLKENEKLVVCRLTGYGQNGPMNQEAGHDINYVSITGLLPVMSGQNRGRPWPPVNLLADFAGGGLTAAYGIMQALFHRERSGKGCIIDNSMVEGLAYLGSFVTYYHDQSHLFTDQHCAFGGEFPLYRTYECKDGKYVAVGALELKFAQNLLDLLNLDISYSDIMQDPKGAMEKIEAKFKEATRDEWIARTESKDCCVTPVLDIDECGSHSHNNDRNSFVKENGRWIPQPAPRFYSGEEFKAVRNEKSKI